MKRIAIVGVRLEVVAPPGATGGDATFADIVGNLGQRSLALGRRAPWRDSAASAANLATTHREKMDDKSDDAFAFFPYQAIAETVNLAHKRLGDIMGQSRE